jgi:isopentenyl phosphate kinase
MKLIKVVKYGGSLFTKKGLKPPNLSDILDRYEVYVRIDVIRRAAVETTNAIKEYERKGISLNIWIGHGVGPYGHYAVEVLGVTPKVRNYCRFLNDLVADIFKEEGIPAETVDLSETCYWDGKQFLINDFLRKGKEVIKRGNVPITFGTIVDSPIGFEIISTDDFVVLTADSLQCDQALMWTDVDVCDKDPKMFNDAKPVRIIRSHLDIQTTMEETDKTGSIGEKIRKMELIAKGIECRIINGMVDGNIYRALIGENIGTLIKP